MGAVIANLMAVGLALAVLSVPFPRGQRRSVPPPAATPPAERMPLPARSVARETIAIRTPRLAKVLEAPVAAGDGIAAGQPLLVLRDLAIAGKRAAAQDELRRLEADAAAVEARSAAARQTEARVRAEAVRRLEKDYRAALQDFARWQELFDEGLLARVEYERRKQDMESRRLEAKSAREAADRLPVPDVRPESRSLARSRRMLERLDALADTFVLRAPRDAVVAEIAVSPGDTPVRGAVLMLLAAPAR